MNSCLKVNEEFCHGCKNDICGQRGHTVCLGRNLYVCEGVAVAAVMWKS